MSANRDWLEERFEIFRTICLPSVVAQTCQNFVWHLYFDRNTPEDYMARVRALVAAHAHIKIILCDEFNDQSRADAVRAELKPATEWLLTTRIDNDDGWHRDFVRRLQASLSFDRAEFLNFPVGILYYDEKTFLYRHSSNAFISLMEPAEAFRTVWCGKHLELDHIAPIRQLSPSPAFLQMIHPGTRSNKPRGVRVHRLLARVGFEAIIPALDNANSETDGEIAAFNATIVPLWAARDRAISLAKTLITRLKGASRVLKKSVAPPDSA